MILGDNEFWHPVLVGHLFKRGDLIWVTGHGWVMVCQVEDDQLLCSKLTWWEKFRKRLWFRRQLRR